MRGAITGLVDRVQTWAARGDAHDEWLMERAELLAENERLREREEWYSDQVGGLCEHIDELVTEKAALASELAALRGGREVWVTRTAICGAPVHAFESREALVRIMGPEYESSLGVTLHRCIELPESPTPDAIGPNAAQGPAEGAV